MRAHQEFTPALRRRLAFTVSASGTCAEAAELTAEWGVAVDDSTLRALRNKPSDGWKRRLPNASLSAPPAPRPC